MGLTKRVTTGQIVGLNLHTGGTQPVNPSPPRRGVVGYVFDTDMGIEKLIRQLMLGRAAPG